MRSTRLTLALLALPCALAAADTFIFSGDRLEANLAKGRERTILSGNARLASDQFVIQADGIELYGQDYNLALCRGSVRVTDAKNDATFSCDTLEYDRKERIIRLQGGAVMEDRKNEMVIKGELLEDRDKEGITLIQVGVRILKKDLATRSQMARYFRGENRLELSGLPVVRWKGDTYRASRIRVDLKNDKIALEGAVQGEVSYEEKKKDEGPAPPAVPPAPETSVPLAGQAAPPTAPAQPGQPAQPAVAPETPR